MTYINYLEFLADYDPTDAGPMKAEKHKEYIYEESGNLIEDVYSALSNKTENIIYYDIRNNNFAA